jgi:hypothetical protein
MKFIIAILVSLIVGGVVYYYSREIAEEFVKDYIRRRDEFM